MTTHHQEEALFDAARNLPSAAARRAFLDQACGNNAELRRRLEELLQAGAEAENFFEQGLPPRGPRPAPSPTALEFSHVGRYKLLQKIGEGGGGVVYMAEQEQPVRRRVALKILKLGMDTRSVIARFEAERQALAMMDHPNIARVLDAGATESGRPYFVMELVRGIKITEYCDQNRLDTRTRLELFVQICQAIQHAHQKGIIHRDIKPSNILVTSHDGVPVPKVIDFGIAKATEVQLTEKTLFTAFEQIIGTPAYMSPEQAELSGLDIDTRTDIYSLGVLLYELLTGRTPFDAKKLMEHGVSELRRTLREQEPQRPSTMVTTLQKTELSTTAAQRHAEPPKLISLLRGDLDWIVMKALEKDRRRRYETANGLAMDVQRYLANEPVLARPPSRAYRFQKLVRRNKIVFTAAFAVVATLLVGFGVSTRLFFLERAARRQAVAAELQAEQARANEAELRRLAETREKITQASVLLNEEEYDDADALVRNLAIARPTVEGAAVFRALGEWHAFHGRWKPAAQRFTTLLQIDHLDGWDVTTLDYLECGPALIEAGDRAGYEEFRRAAVARFADGNLPFSDRILKIDLLVPADDTMMKALQPLVEATSKFFATNSGEEVDIFLAAWRSVSLGLWEYRHGNYQAAADWCRRCLNYPEYIAPRTATAEVILAMADEKLGSADEARAELAQATAIIEAKFHTEMDRGTPVQGFWFDWEFGRILLREATDLIAPPANAPDAAATHSQGRSNSP
ncbi:MAG TPA: serine/threonine-protein kinase [Verrucomicrobiae bacterium]|nr:serine/threonine-protein kinase [Verrucomicrobiae bacterium]